jgi:hypothetical protein
MNYYDKYIKYKNKYYNAKIKLLYGGGVEFDNTSQMLYFRFVSTVNQDDRFTDLTNNKPLLASSLLNATDYITNINNNTTLNKVVSFDNYFNIYVKFSTFILVFELISITFIDYDGKNNKGYTMTYNKPLGKKLVTITYKLSTLQILKGRQLFTVILAPDKKNVTLTSKDTNNVFKLISSHGKKYSQETVNGIYTIIDAIKNIPIYNDYTLIEIPYSQQYLRYFKYELVISLPPPNKDLINTLIIKKNFTIFFEYFNNKQLYGYTIIQKQHQYTIKYLNLLININNEDTQHIIISFDSYSFTFSSMEKTWILNNISKTDLEPNILKLTANNTKSFNNKSFIITYSNNQVTINGAIIKYLSSAYDLLIELFGKLEIIVSIVNYFIINAKVMNS